MPYMQNKSKKIQELHICQAASLQELTFTFQGKCMPHAGWFTVEDDVDSHVVHEGLNLLAQAVRLLVVDRVGVVLHAQGRGVSTMLRTKRSGAAVHRAGACARHGEAERAPPAGGR